MRLLPLLFILLTSCSHTIYVVRHAEKAAAGPNMNSDVPLSVPGQQRADDLKEVLKDKKIGLVYSTQTVRTVSTATPTADEFGVAIELYGPRPDSAFISKVLAQKKNLLIVGHSNTVDDIVNMLCGSTQVPGDLNEKEYDNLFEVKVKGKKKTFSRLKFGAKSE